MIGEIPESEATGGIARCYAEIRERFGLPVVNLIWRHLAALGEIEACWDQIRDSLPRLTAHAGELNATARSLARDCPPLAPLAMSRTGADILAAYERGNSLNLSTVRLLLGCEPTGGAAPDLAPDLAPAPARIPPVPSFADLPAETRGRVDRLAAAGPGADTMIRPTLWVHLALDPAFLAAAEEPVVRLLSSPAFGAAHAALVARPARPAGAPALSQALGLALDRFNRRIGEMLLFGLCLGTSLTVTMETRT